MYFFLNFAKRTSPPKEMGKRKTFCAFFFSRFDTPIGRLAVCDICLCLSKLCWKNNVGRINLFNVPAMLTAKFDYGLGTKTT